MSQVVDAGHQADSLVKNTATEIIQYLVGQGTISCSCGFREETYYITGSDIKFLKEKYGVAPSP